jgi:hypothetical protein
MRDMNLAYFINHTKDVRLRFTPDPREPFPKAMMIPGENLGINHKIAATGISLRPPKRTKTRCIRTVTYSPTQCGDNNHGDRRASA